MTRSKSKIKSSKSSGNLTFLGLKNKNQNKYGSKHIANYYKDVDGVIQLADSTLINILVHQVENYGLIYAIQVLKHEIEEYDNKEMYRFYQISKKLFEKPEGDEWVIKDNIYSSIHDGGGSSEIPIEFMVDAVLQDSEWYNQADRMIVLTNTALLQNENTEKLVPRAIETIELDRLYDLVQSNLKNSFKESRAASGTGETNAEKWLSITKSKASTIESIDYSFTEQFPILRSLIDINPDIGMKPEQVKEVTEGKDSQITDQLRLEVWEVTNKVDLSFVIPLSQVNVMEGSENYESIKKYFLSMDFELDHTSIKHHDRSADEDQSESMVKVRDLELAALYAQSGVMRPWPKKVSKQSKLQDKVMQSNATQVAANLKVVQKQDEGKEKNAEILEACMRHMKQNGVILEVVPSTTMTSVNGTEVYGLQRDQLIRAGKILGKKALHCFIKHLSGQIFIWDIWARVMGKLLISNDPDKQSMALKYFDSMFTEEGVKRIDEKYIKNSSLTKAILGHNYGNSSMAVVWELAGEKEETVTKISLINQITHEVLLEPVIDNGETKHFFRRDFETWILDVGKLIVASGSVIDIADLIKVMFACHPLASQGSDAEVYPMNNWENMTGEVLLKNDDLEPLVKDIEANDAWKSIRGRTHVMLNAVCRVLHRRNKDLDITEELAESIMCLFQKAYEEKREEWNSSPDDGYIREKDIKTESYQPKESDDNETISTESTLSVVVRANSADVTEQLNKYKISQVQRAVTDLGSNLCATHSLTDSCYFGAQCRNRHEGDLNPEDGWTLIEGIKKTISASDQPGINITYKGGTPANEKMRNFNSANPGVRKKFVKNLKRRVNSTKTGNQETDKSVTWASDVKNNTTSGKEYRKNRSRDKVDHDQADDKGKGGRGSFNNQQNNGRGGYKGYNNPNDYYGKGNPSPKNTFNRGKGGRGKGGRGKGGQGYSGRNAQPLTNRGQTWRTGDISSDGESVFIGTNQNQKLSFMPKQSYAHLENSIFDSMHRMYNDMVDFQSVAGFATFFEKCAHGCVFHTLHAKKCLCANQHQDNCGVWPCVVTVFLPRMGNKEGVGLNSLGRNINLRTKNQGITIRKDNSPWRTHMSKRQILNDRLLNEDVIEVEDEDSVEDNEMVVAYKNIQEVEKEEEEIIKRLNLLKSTKSKMKLANRTNAKGSTRFVRVQGN